MIRTRQVDLSSVELVQQLGTVFAVFDERSQDSGHISYGVDTGARRLFVKTSGGPDPSPSGMTRDQRSEVLRRSALVHQVDHPALIELDQVIDTVDGVALLHDWFEGELLRCPAELRNDPGQAHNRFKALPAPTIAAALDRVIDLHVVLERAGWVLGDFYDACLMYDFDHVDIRMMDFECYQRGGAYRNDRGRLPGSTRFMAPEEFRLGAVIDSRTTVFNLARMVEIFYLPADAAAPVRALIEHATAEDPADRPPSAADFQLGWRSLPATSGTG